MRDRWTTEGADVSVHGSDIRSDDARFGMTRDVGGRVGGTRVAGDPRIQGRGEVAARPDWDVVIAGAGPGGTSSAIRLAEAGVRVLVLEREIFPRFHIGESLLPAAELLVTDLGVDPDPNVFLFKRGAQFVCEETGRRQSFDFNEAMPGPQRHAWQVDRARFDTLLRDRAIEAGAEVRHGVRVDRVEFGADGVRVGTGGDRVCARYFIDATGQDRLLGKQMGTIRAYEQFGKAAVYTHYSQLSEATQQEFAPYNDIRIVSIPDGWLWAIPLTKNRLSVGLVTRRSGLRKKRLDDYIDHSPLFQRLLAGAHRHATELVGNFSFENTAPSGARFACVGDSACFIDPVFSSGVSLAIHRGLVVADRLLPALESGRESDPDLMQPMEASMKRGYDTFASLVYRFYNTRFVENLIYNAPDDGRLRSGVISVLAGDVFREDNDFQDMLLASRRHRKRAGGSIEAHEVPV
ncbi:MAG TPA: NAD(P)/FAD-dependent oxidoreductase [Deltaproteobacteria bacterium]|nr:NAD(P)/FAD-dependent oxidoreductase [Deltaproteobacteria bacterium]